MKRNNWSLMFSHRWLRCCVHHFYSSVTVLERSFRNFRHIHCITYRQTAKVSELILNGGNEVMPLRKTSKVDNASIRWRAIRNFVQALPLLVIIRVIVLLPDKNIIFNGNLRIFALILNGRSKIWVWVYMLPFLSVNIKRQ